MNKGLLLLVLPALLLVAQAQILAIDYGTQFIKASLVHAGAGKAFSIVENPKSQRKFINSVLTILSSSAYTMRSASMRQTPSPSDHEDPRIASSTPASSSISMTSHLALRLFAKISFSTISPSLKLISCLLSSCWQGSLRSRQR